MRQSGLVLGFVVLAAAVIPSVAATRGVPRVELEGVHLDEAHPGAPRSLDAVIIGAPRDAALSSWTLVQVDVDPPVVVPALDRRAYLDDSDSIAIALVVQGHRMLMGFDAYEADPDLRSPGVLAVLPGVVESLSKAVGATTTGTLIVYGHGARVVAPMQPLATLRADAFGRQADYEQEITRDLVAGVEVAIDQLERVVARRRALIVIGDGADTNVDGARRALAALRTEAERTRIDLYAVNYVAGLGDELIAIKALVDEVTVVTSFDQIEPTIQGIVDGINDRFVLSFRSPPIDGCPHDFELRFNGTPVPNRDSIQTINTLPLGRCQVPSGHRSWPWILGGLGIAMVVATTLYVRRRRRAE